MNPFAGLGGALGQAQSFIFGSGAQAPSYEALQKKREIIDALQQQAAAAPLPQSHAEGVTNVIRALAGKWGDARLSRKEDAERGRLNESMQSIIASLSGGGGPTMSSMGGGTPGFVPPGVGGAPASQPRADFQLPPGAGDFSQLFPQIEQEFRLPQGYLSRTAQIESGGDPSARNPNSSAKGLFQFIDSTAKQYGVNPMDPVSSTQGAARLAADNAAHLSRVLGREPSAAELYLAHQQGAGGAAKLLASPDARAVDIVGPDAVRLNGGDASMSARDFAGLWLGKFEGGGGGSAGGYSGGGGSSGPNYEVIAQLGEMMGNPYLSEGQQAVAKALIEQQMGGGGMTEYQRAQIDMQRQRLDLDQQRIERDSRGEYGLSPVWGTDAEGNPAMIQLGRDGNPIQTPIPDGFAVANKPLEIDAGDRTILLDPQTRQPIGEIPKDVRSLERERGIGEAEGKAVGGAVAGLPGAQAQVDQSVALIDSIIADPALESITGMFQGRLPPMSQAGTDLNVKVDQLKGKAFLEAFESLKGGGAITEREGEAATQAMARLNRAQSTEEFQRSLEELRTILTLGVERMRAKAGQAGAAAAPAAPADMPQSAMDAGIDPSLWQFMDPEQRALWSN